MKISIITPSLNQGKFIEATIKSVLNQGIKDLEYIVVDGGSKDETLAILKKYQKEIILISEKDKGQSQAVNKGLKKASGEIIGWLNSDDLYYPGALKEVLAYFSNNRGCQILYGDYMFVNEKGEKLFGVKEIDFDRNIFLKSGVNYIFQPTVFWRRNLLDEVGYLDESYDLAMDTDYWKRVIEAGYEFSHIRQYLAQVRWHQESKSLKYKKRQIEEGKRIFGNQTSISWYYRTKRQLLRLLTRGEFNLIPNDVRLRKLI